jgi:large repetitive protein
VLATTDAGGNYSFAGISAGLTYTVCQTQPAGYADGGVNTGTNGSSGAANGITITGLPTTGSAGNQFGERVGSISGAVYADVSSATPANTNNGARDAGELGIAGVTVTLTGRDINGNPVSLSTTTDASGNYRFDDLLQSDATGYTLTEGSIPVLAGSFNDGRDTAGSAGGSTTTNDLISAIVLPAGTTATGYLFGELPVATVAGTVYIDRNRNGTPDPQPTDGRIAGVTVTLVEGGAVVASTTTDASGNYSFTGISAGLTYTVCQTQPAGYADGGVNTGTNGSSGAANGITITNLPAAGSAGNHFGERVGSISGAVYADVSSATPTNTNNGVRDAGELGIAGVTVTLTGRDINGNPVSLSTTTDASGNYRFDDLLQSDATGYTLSEGSIPPAAGRYNDGRDSVGSAGGSNAVNDQLSAIVLSAGAQATGYLFGELPIAPITGTVYIDRNRDGVLDAIPTDGRIAGVTLTLVEGGSCSGAVVATTTTDASGNYGFAGASTGLSYTVCQAQPAGYADGGVNTGTSGSSGAANGITITNLAAAGSAGNHFGERVGSISGAVYADVSGATPANTNNGVRDAGEAGIAGVTVTLTGRDISGTTVSLSTTADASGNYRFDDLLQSDATGYTLTEGTIPPAAGRYNDGRDSVGSAGGSSTVNDVLSAIVLPAGAQASGYLFGELPVATIAGTVYIDRNRDGALDATPTDGRIAGVTLTLVEGGNCSGTVVGSTTTDASGNYGFAAASTGLTYTVCQTQPTGYADGGVNPGAAGSSGAANRITVSNLPAAGSAGNHFGERVGSIAGAVYLDANHDGLRQGGEAGIAAVAVTLSGTDASGAAVSRSTTTDASGNFRFDDLLAADGAGYTLTEQAAQPVVGGTTTLNGRTTAGSVAGGTLGSASGLASTPSSIGAITLPPGGDGVAYLFGEILPVGIAGGVFTDANNNGRQDAPGDTGLPGVTLVITGTDDTGAAVSRPVTTAADGSYSVPDLRPGTYAITQPSQPAGTSNGITTAGPQGGSATPQATTPSAISGIVLTTPGTVAGGNQFAEVPASSAVSGRVWTDANHNGSIDPTETGIAGVTLTLTGTDVAGRPVSASTTTDASGNYRFDNLAPGSYTVTEPAQPAGTLDGTARTGSTGGSATPVGSTPSVIGSIPLAAGQSSSGNDFGELPAGQIGGRVYADNNNNGTVDATEGGLGGVTITSTGTDDLGRPVNTSTTTAADGSFTFTDLRPGTYTLTQPSQPAGTVNGLTSAGPLGGTATGPGTTPSAIAGIVLPPGGLASGNLFGELGNSPDLLVSQTHAPATLTVGHPSSWPISVRNGGQVASSGAYTVDGRLPTGLTLAATPSGNGWVCTGAAGAASFSCVSSTVLAPGATHPGVISVSANVGAAAVPLSPVSAWVMVDGGGEIDARRPGTTERNAFNSNPASLPVCLAGIAHNVCREPAPVQLPAAVAGTVWFDIGSTARVLDGGDQRLPGWTVEVLDKASGQIVGRATTATDGSWRVADLVPGVELQVRFREPGSGVVFGTPVNGETGSGSSGVACATGLPAAGTASSCAGTGVSPQLTVVLAPGQTLQQQSLPVDPSGVVYDSGQRNPVPGAVVALAPVANCPGWDPSTSIVGATLGGYTVNGNSIAMTVGANGFYQFLIAPSAPASCTFGLTVTPPPGFVAPSLAIPPAAGPLVPGGAAGSVVAVQPQPGAPTGAIGAATLYYLTFTTGSAGANVVHNHIPVDAALPASVALSKTGDKARAEVGDSVRYTITVAMPNGPRPRQTTVVDRLPAGFTYIPGTATVNDRPIADPVGGLGPTLSFNLGPAPADGRLVLRYRVRVGVGAQQGDGINRAQAVSCVQPAGCVGPGFAPVAGSVASNEGRHRVQVTGGVFTTDACVLGKVFIDCNGNHVQDREELGIPGVRLVLSDGSTLVSDSEGKYSVCGLPPRGHVLRIDPLTLPRGARLATSSNRNLGDAGSLWLDLKNGELHRADFVEGSCSNTVLEQTKARRAQGEVRAPETERQGGAALRFDSKAHGLDTQRSPQQGTDGANQQAPKVREPAAADPAAQPAGPQPPRRSQDDSNVPTPQLPMNRPPPPGRDPGTAPDATTKGASNGTR